MKVKSMQTAMKKMGTLVSVAICFLCVFPYVAFSEIISVKELINNSEKYDAKEVVIQAEAIGAIMDRDSGSWVNVNDETAALGIWMNRSQAAKIQFLGKYNTIGDFLEIEGRFNARCKMHGGDMDVHADQMRILWVGHMKYLSQDTLKIKIFLFLIGALACLYIIKLLKKKQ